MISDIKLIPTIELQNSNNYYINQGYKTLLPNVLLDNNFNSNKFLKDNQNITNALGSARDLAGDKETIAMTMNIIVKYDIINNDNFYNFNTKVITNVQLSNTTPTLYSSNNMPILDIFTKPFIQLENCEQFLVTGTYLTNTSTTNKYEDIYPSIFTSYNVVPSDIQNPSTFNNLKQKFLVGQNILFKNESYDKYISGIGLCYNVITNSDYLWDLDTN